MAETEFAHCYDCDEDTYWRDVVFNEAFNRRLYLEHLRFERWEMLSFEEDEHRILRSVEIVPTTGEIPRALRKLASSIGFREQGRFDKKTRVQHYEMITKALPDRVTIDGRMFCKPRDGGIERIVQLRVVAKIFGVGQLIERRIIADTIKSYDLAREYVRTTLGF